ncbi:Crp/Fnr family transcriptional regulator [Sediminibacillus albus]|uniref:Cyclic nucleotide-binding domain-containing protein n=1 Tax=Sediminibacillus albus TaxID=407036 RepID=A0A1G8VJ80_9BACI|nr:Crp/Fnr family transcriptional regulator [Sediminibacillus albus]SDJ65375.1 Cyclic nucleotide-binding domain-containing protein [Sediminibacillus albus]
MKLNSQNAKKNVDHQTYKVLNSYGIQTGKTQNEIIYSHEQRTNSVFYITKGFVRLVNRDKCSTKIIGAGEFFGDRSIFYSKNMYAEALSEVEYIRIDDISFSRLMNSEPKLAVKMITSISKNYIYLTEQQNLFSVTKEYFLQRKKGYPRSYRIKKQERSICCQ